jgi:hypothetical protein
MSPRRLLGETLAELAGGLLEATAVAPLGLSSVELDLPLDLRLDAAGELEGDLPLFRLRTAFDPEPARLRIVLGEAAP